MKHRMVSILLLIALLLPTSACPGTVSLKYGVWIFTITVTGNPNSFDVGVALLQHGFSVQAPNSYPGSFSIFGGPVTWQQNGSNVSFFNDVGPGYVYDGAAQSSTSMNGTWQEVGDPSYGGTWTAVWDPES